MRVSKEDRAAVLRYLAYEAAGLSFELPASDRLGERLVKHGAIDRVQLLAALIDQQRYGGRIGDAVVRLGMCTRWLVERFASQVSATASPRPASAHSRARGAGSSTATRDR